MIEVIKYCKYQRSNIQKNVKEQKITCKIVPYLHWRRYYISCQNILQYIPTETIYKQIVIIV